MQVEVDATWCGYCKVMEGTVWKEAEENGLTGKVQLAHIEADTDPEVHDTEAFKFLVGKASGGYPAHLMVAVNAEGKMRIANKSNGEMGPAQALAFVEHGGKAVVIPKEMKADIIKRSAELKQEMDGGRKPFRRRNKPN